MKLRLYAIALLVIVTFVAGLAAANYWGAAYGDGSPGKPSQDLVCKTGAKFCWEYSRIYGVIAGLSWMFTFFGMLIGHSRVSEKQIRLAITTSFLVMFVVIFNIVAFWDGSEKVSEYLKLLLPSLSSIIAVVVGAYFVASAAVEIAEGPSKKEEGENQNSRTQT